MNSAIISLLLLPTLSNAAPAPKFPVVAKKPATARIQMALNIYGHWLEMRIDSRGKVNRDPFDMMGWTLKSNEAGVWLRRGEAVYTKLGVAHIRIGKKFIHLDIVNKKKDGRVFVRPGIATIKRGKLIWIRLDDALKNPTAAEVKAKRPKSFVAHRKPGYLRVFLDRVKDKYDTDINVRDR